MDQQALPLFPDHPETVAANAPATVANGPHTIIIGGGLAGLASAIQLHRANKRFVLLEASDAVGGRIRTDLVDGFRLDRGFQVLLTGYPEARRVLDLNALNLRSFLPGALVRQGGSFHRFADPFRELRKSLVFALDPIVPLGDKLRVAQLRHACLGGNGEAILTQPEESTREYLRRFGFSPIMLERFFEPFFGGIFLERNLATSARWFRWLFRIFSSSLAAVPELGMQQIPAQLAACLPMQSVHLNTQVAEVNKTTTGWEVLCEGGEVHSAARLIVATAEPETRALVAPVHKPGPAPQRTWNRTTTFYYAASQPPIDEPVVVLNGDGPTAGPVNHLAVMSLVAPSYAPPGAHLICANVVGAAPDSDAAMEAMEVDVRTQLRRWFGSQVSRWDVLAGYPIAHALPFQTSTLPVRHAPTASGVLLAGDHTTTSSINGTIASGTRAADAAIAIAD